MRWAMFGGLWFTVSLCAQIPAVITPHPSRTTPHPAPASGVLRIDSSLVVIPAWVTTASGTSVTSLTKEDFRLTDDNVEQKIDYFIRDDAPLSVGVLFDASGSMKSKMEKASESVAAFLRTANTEDEFFLVEFNERAKLTVPFTPDAEAISSRVLRTKPFGRTSLFDSISLALKNMKKARHQRKALVIISDGGDNWSWHTAGQIRNALLESDVQLYAMGIFDPVLTKAPVENRKGPALLDELATETGGRHYPVGDLNDLPAISEKIGLDLRNEYLLGYYAADNSRDGKYHHVKLKVTAPEGMPALRANYRRGYYATQ